MTDEEIDRVTPVFWGLFSAGGFLVAWLLPVLVVMNGLAYPFGLLPASAVTYGGAVAWFGSWLAKLFIVVVVGGSLFHGLHRLKYVLIDIGAPKRVLEPVVYGVAAAGTVAAALLAFLL